MARHWSEHMATNIGVTGDRLELIAPVGGVVSGNVYVIGDDLVVVALTSAAATETFTGSRRGVYTLPKEAGLVIAAGDMVHWATDDEEITLTPSDPYCGVAVEASGASATTVKVLLTPDLVPSVVEGLAGLMGDLTALPQHNYAGSAAPTTADDSAAGYSVGSMWFDTSNDEIYGCVDATEGAAVWKQLSNAA